MARFFQTLLAFFKALWSRFMAFGQRIGWFKIAVAAVGILVGLVGARVMLGGSPVVAPENTVRQVTVQSVAELSNLGSPLSLVGTVQSTAQATLRAESAGPVIAVYHSLGDYVAAGAVLAELENASQRAAVLQAQGGVDAAQAALNKISVSGESAKATALNALLSAYASVDSAIRATADTMITNPTGNNPQFTVTSSDSQLVATINNTRILLTTILNRESSRASTLTQSDDLAAEIAKTLEEVRAARTFIDTIIAALNSGIPSATVSQTTISGYIIVATAARTSLTTALSSLASAQSTLASAQQPGTNGASPDIAAGQAALTQARGALAAARANLEKSIIRAPISGTINSLSLKRGDFVQQLSPVATIANNAALEIVAYLSQQDTISSAEGDRVDIDGGGNGIITHIAPALDPVTKKIEMRIGVLNNVSLLNGQSVIVSLPHSVKTTPAKPGSKITIPISAIKVGAQEVDVFIVASSTATAHPVILGELLGDRVVVTAGLTPDMTIVVDARGLRDGETVEIVK
jgi:multidrug efflux pump subunit AcrA (membrane-fusion protein)